MAMSTSGTTAAASVGMPSGRVPIPSSETGTVHANRIEKR